MNLLSWFFQRGNNDLANGIELYTVNGLTWVDSNFRLYLLRNSVVMLSVKCTLVSLLLLLGYTHFTLNTLCLLICYRIAMLCMSDCSITISHLVVVLGWLHALLEYLDLTAYLEWDLWRGYSINSAIQSLLYCKHLFKVSTIHVCKVCYVTMVFIRKEDNKRIKGSKGICHKLYVRLYYFCITWELFFI